MLCIDSFPVRRRSRLPFPLGRVNGGDDGAVGRGLVGALPLRRFARAA